MGRSCFGEHLKHLRNRSFELETPLALLQWAGQYLAMNNPPIQDILDLAFLLTNMSLTKEGHELMDRYETGEITLAELIAAIQPAGQ